MVDSSASPYRVIVAAGSGILNGSQGGQFAIYKNIDRCCATGIGVRGTEHLVAAD